MREPAPKTIYLKDCTPPLCCVPDSKRALAAIGNS